MYGKIVLSKKDEHYEKTYLPLSDEDRDYLKALSKKENHFRHKVVDRARILLYKADGMTFQQIADKLAISTATVRLCISKFQKGGLDAALFDVQRPGRPSESLMMQKHG